MMRAPRWRWVAVALVIALAGVFSWLNAEEAVALHFGFTDLYQVPVVTVAYLAFLLGMATMFVLGLGHDLRVRRLLRERGLLDEPRPDPVYPEPAFATPELDPPPPPDLPPPDPTM